MIQMTEEEEEEERMALYVAYLLIPSLFQSPLPFPFFFFLQLSHVTLAIPGKQLLSPVAWLNFQSDPSHSHGNLIIASYKLVPFHLRLHISTYNTHFTIQWREKKRTWWVKEREVCKWCTCCLQVKYCVGVLSFG